MRIFRSEKKGGGINFSISPNSPCPCGCGKPASECCLTNQELHKAPASTTPPPPKSGEHIRRCYASRLADCSSTLSREHYISASLLHYLDQFKNLTVSGLPWLNGQEKVLPPDALASKILCERHNSALSPLDAMAVHLFQAFDEEGVAGSGQQLLHLFSGHDLERWLLKMLCGLAFSGNLTTDVDCDLSIPRLWLDVLFGHADLTRERGLYVCVDKGHQFAGPHGLEMRAITGKGRLTGIGLTVCGYELILSMSGFPTRRFNKRRVAYRPQEFHATGPNCEKSVVFSWDGEADRGTIHTGIGRSWNPSGS